MPTFRARPFPGHLNPLLVPAAELAQLALGAVRVAVRAAHRVVLGGLGIAVLTRALELAHALHFAVLLFALGAVEALQFVA